MKFEDWVNEIDNTSGIYTNKRFNEIDSQTIKRFHKFIAKIIAEKDAEIKEVRDALDSIYDGALQGAGWMHAECCTLLDRDIDPRGQDVAEMIPRLKSDLALTPKEEK